MKNVIILLLSLTSILAGCGDGKNKKPGGEVVVDRGVGSPDIRRVRVPGGWLYYFDDYHGGMTFVPDPNAEKDGR